MNGQGRARRNAGRRVARVNAARWVTRASRSLLIAAVIVGVSQPVASARGLDAEATRVVADVLRPRLAEGLVVGCHRVLRARRERGRWACSWRGARTRADRTRRCRGRSRAVLLRQTWRVRTLRRKCSLQPSDSPQAGTFRYFGFSDNSWLDPINGVTPVEEADLAAAAGANSHRVFFDWRYAEPQRDAISEANIAHYTRMYDALMARGIRPLITIGLAPSWAWEPGVSCSGDCRYPPARSKDDEWAEIVAEVTRRFPGAAGIEIWNEPNIDVFWRHPDPKRYVELLRIAYDTIKAINPRMVVVGGALANIRTTEDGRIGTGAFLDDAYRYGMAAKMDVLSVHSYPFAMSFGPGSLFDSAFADVTAVLRARGDVRRRLWVTEVGVSTSDPRAQYHFDDAQQAAMLLGVYRDLAARGNVEAVFFHSLLDRPRYPAWHQEFGYGVVRPGDPPTPKPAFCRWVELAGNSFAGC